MVIRFPNHQPSNAAKINGKKQKRVSKTFIYFSNKAKQSYFSYY